MTDIYHPSQVLLPADDPQANPTWTTIIGAVIAIMLVTGAAHFADHTVGDPRLSLNSEQADVKPDGRGKWTGYM